MGAACQSHANTAMTKLTDVKDKTMAKLNKKKDDAAKEGEDSGLISGEQTNDLLEKAQGALKDSGVDVNKIIGDNVDPAKILNGAIDSAPGLKDQLKKQGLTDEKINKATEQASRYIKPEEGADKEKVQKEVTENPDVQEFIGSLRSVGDEAGVDKDKPVSAEESKEFLDSIKTQFGGIFDGKNPDEIKKDVAAAQSGDAGDMAKLAQKYFKPEDVKNLIKNHGDDIKKMVDKQGGVSGVADKLQGAMGDNKPNMQRVTS